MGKKRRVWKNLTVKHMRNTFEVEHKKAYEEMEVGDFVTINGDDFATGTFNGPEGSKYKLMIGVLHEIIHSDKPVQYKSQGQYFI